MGASDMEAIALKRKPDLGRKTLAAGAVIKTDACPVRPHDLTHYRKA